MMYGIEDNYWNEINAVLSRYPHVNEAILFGSRAKGTNKPFSDVDMALAGDEINIDDVLGIKTDIDDLLLPYEFDFCIYGKIKSNELKNHIDRRGIIVYKKTDAHN